MSQNKYQKFDFFVAVSSEKHTICGFPMQQSSTSIWKLRCPHSNSNVKATGRSLYVYWHSWETPWGYSSYLQALDGKNLNYIDQLEFFNKAVTVQDFPIFFILILLILYEIKLFWIRWNLCRKLNSFKQLFESTILIANMR